MVATDQAAPEPTPEFNTRCMELLAQWEGGQRPVEEVLATLTQMSQEAHTENHLVDQGRAEQLLAYVYHIRGHLETSIHHNERAHRLFMTAGNERRAGIIELNQGENYRFKGNFSRAVRLFQSAQRIAAKYDSLTAQTIATVNEGLVLVTLKQDKEAYRVLNAGFALADQWPLDTDSNRQSHGRMLSEIYYGKAVIYLRAGEHQRAWSNAVEALRLANSTGDPILRGYANRTIAEVITALGGVPDDDYAASPDDYFREAMNAFKELDAQAEIARTMFAQAISLGQRGRRTTAARKLQHVMSIFSQLGMVDDAARAAEAQLGLI
jgi:tetratricopeptide (TPR) repeat protein